MSTFLTQYVAIYVPSTDHSREDGKADPKARVSALNQIGSILSDKFGGFTQSEAVGGWNSDKLGLVREHVTIVKAFYDGSQTNPTEAVQLAEQIARKVCKLFHQEAVTVETEKGIEFIS